MKTGSLFGKCAIAFARSRFVTFGCNSARPEVNIALAYLFYILAGFLLLMLPFSTQSASAGAIDHLFTAASAVSTTGLATVDVPATYSVFGMCVILALIQLGAAGYMTVSSYLMLHITHRMTRRSKSIMSASLSAPYGMSIKSIVNNVVSFTLIFESIGFVALWITFGCLGVETPAWNALFVSVSSFCTAGFSPFPDSLCAFSGNYAVNLTVALLSYTGAMGFIVITDLKRRCLDRGYRITFTTRVILSITLWMTVAGTAVLLAFPAKGQSADLSARCLESFFQSMTAMTTVGFNTFDLARLAPVSVLVISVIMFIGASPSGTGGGVKSTTLSASYAFVISMLKGRKHVSLRGNRLPYYRVDAALANIIVYGSVLLCGTLLLTISDDFDLSAILFEAASALGTVGITLGITPALTTAGKIVIIALMYIGRIGVLTLGAAIMAHAADRRQIRPSDIAV